MELNSPIPRAPIAPVSPWIAETCGHSNQHQQQLASATTSISNNWHQQQLASATTSTSISNNQHQQQPTSATTSISNNQHQQQPASATTSISNNWHQQQPTSATSSISNNWHQQQPASATTSISNNWHQQQLARCVTSMQTVQNPHRICVHSSITATSMQTGGLSSCVAKLGQGSGVAPREHHRFCNIEAKSCPDTTLLRVQLPVLLH